MIRTRREEATRVTLSQKCLNLELADGIAGRGLMLRSPGRSGSDEAALAMNASAASISAADRRRSLNAQAGRRATSRMRVVRSNEVQNACLRRKVNVKDRRARENEERGERWASRNHARSQLNVRGCAACARSLRSDGGR